MLQYGFESFDQITKYLGTTSIDYDIVLLDIDSNEAFVEFGMDVADKNFFVTAFDNYSLKKGLEVIGKMEEQVIMTKILFSRDMLQEDDDYLNFLSFYFSVKWNEEKIYFPYDQGDNTVIIKNQRLSQIKLKELNQLFREGLILIAELIAPEVKGGDIKKAVKKIM